MAHIDTDMRRIVGSAKLAFVATVGPDGSPNVSPKGSVRVFDDEHLVFMDIDSPRTVANLIADPRVEIAVVDFLRRRGYRFSGTAEIREAGSAAYNWLNEWLLERNGPGYPANRVVLVHVERALPVRSPAYTFGHAEEDELTAQWLAGYSRSEPPG